MRLKTICCQEHEVLPVRLKSLPTQNFYKFTAITSLLESQLEDVTSPCVGHLKLMDQISWNNNGKKNMMSNR